MGNKNFDQIRRDTIIARDERMQSFIPQFKQIISQSKLTQEKIKAIVDSDVVGVVKMLNSHEVTSLQLIAIFGLRAIFIGRELRSITQDYFDYAVKKAISCDQERKKSGKRNWTLEDGDDTQNFLPPLFGIPVSLKDNIDMQGTRSTIGLTMRANKIIEEDSPLVRCLKNSGMIPFMKTNCPQLGFAYQANSYLWGRCLNPWSKSKSAGGSSGGEGSAIASKISVIGVGNDYGGSVRIPAAFCGVYSLLPSTNRIIINEALTSYSQCFNGKDFIKNMNGPLARSVESLALWTYVATTEAFYQGFHDAYIKLFPFNFKLYKQIENTKRSLRIGYFQNFDLEQCSPACLRALRETASYLRDQGHELIKIAIPNESEVILALLAESIGEGGMQGLKDMLEGEPLIPQYKMLNISATLSKLPSFGFKFLKSIVQLVWPRVGKFMEASKRLTTHEYLQKTGRSYELRTEWVNYWRENKLDFVLCPGFGSEAANHGVFDKNPMLAAYTTVWNLLAMTSCSQPITVVREDEQHFESKWKDQWTSAAKESAVDSKGLPVSIQIVGMPFEEEKVLGLSRKIQKHFKFYQKHPLPTYNLD